MVALLSISFADFRNYRFRSWHSFTCFGACRKQLAFDGYKRGRRNTIEPHIGGPGRIRVQKSLSFVKLCWRVSAFWFYFHEHKYVMLRMSKTFSTHFCRESIERAIGPEAIRSFRDLPMRRYEEEIWNRVGRIFTKEPKERIPVSLLLSFFTVKQNLDGVLSN